MNPHIRAIASLLVLGATPVHAQSTAVPIDMAAERDAARETRQDKEITALMALWVGNYDNREQIQTDTDMGRPAGTHVRLHAAIQQVDLPQIGKHVLYVETYRDNMPSHLLHHGLYSIAADESAKAVRVTQIQFKAPQEWVGSIHALDRLTGLSPTDMVPRMGCDVLMRREGDEFLGSTDPNTCKTDQGTGLETHIRLASDGLWLRERTIKTNKNMAVDELAAFAWHQLERARFFSCMIDPPRSMVSAAREKPGEKGYVVRIHDQGGTFTFQHADGRSLFMSLRHTWSYNMNRKTLVVTLQEKDENGPGLGYAWTEPGADRLGMNPLWIHIQCDLDTPDTRAMQKRMRNVL